jgi:hypothetical protein
VLTVFAGKSKFNDVGLGSGDTPQRRKPTSRDLGAVGPDREKGLLTVLFFLRVKVRRNTERYAQFHSVPVTIVETLYEERAHSGR